MEPNYCKAARKAVETMAKFGASIPVRILPILKKLPNVFVIALDIPSIPGHECWDAFACVRERKGTLQYIVVYNQTLPPAKLNLALAREMAHVVLRHSADTPEEVWSEEAQCYGYHCAGFRPPMPKHKKRINFRPKRDSLLWELKGIQSFDSLEHMKAYVADEQTQFAMAIRNQNRRYSPEDVELHGLREFEHCTGWKNCYDIVLEGKTVGYCGE